MSVIVNFPTVTDSKDVDDAKRRIAHWPPNGCTPAELLESIQHSTALVLLSSFVTLTVLGLVSVNEYSAP